ncbi:NAD(P)/FAD-dependent oxidoreductase [Mesorhizobium sp. YR577]|uniref:flavin-containing monooxygenase n=1 Tax=Mesorhizobium sp. YR577 TaxID=1884373 RepID=UPI0008EAABD1|nr:NAD(P)/FAD-dependent oxidoreductase [Mesorhizobium sp. YR577]SFU19641.1 Predicted flavoprotein CzcO associated with the cation diffusion facilitator CzcD [Mesorhizobium sp. YR577]
MYSEVKTKHGDCDFDAIVIGAGSAGLYQLHRLRELGLKVRLLESGTGVGGVWYWNRYPGARFDSESYSYAYFFSHELLRDWKWSEHFAAQPETEQYFNFVADKFDLRRDISFSSTVVSARYREDCCSWVLTLQDGKELSCHYVVAAVGPLTHPTLPAYEGVSSFAGEAYHTARWPKEPVDFEGKRVAVIGTGASGVQTIQEVSKTAKQLTVFQRTANYCVPLGNSKIASEEQQRIIDDYPRIYRRCFETMGGFIHNIDPRSAFDLSPEEREAFWEKLYNQPGLGMWLGNFHDCFVNEEANRLVSEFVAGKIRQRVKDPKVAERLIPKNHGFGTRRVPLETNYYELFNRPTVHLVDLTETPIVRVMPTGIETSDGFFELDMIIYATGFDALTGSFDKIHVEGVGGKTLKDKWADGAETFLGLTASGFPNFFMPGGPMSWLGNIPRGLEYGVDWIAGLIKFMEDNGIDAVDAKAQSEQEWTTFSSEGAQKFLSAKVDSWFTGVNTNVSGKSKRTYPFYRGGGPAYRQRAEQVVREGYAKDFNLIERPAASGTESGRQDTAPFEEPARKAMAG